MLLALDVGNTNITIGVFKKKRDYRGISNYNKVTKNIR